MYLHKTTSNGFYFLSEDVSRQMQSRLLTM